MKRISRDEMFMRIAKTVSERSTCLRKKVGAVIVKDGRVVSMGYNGVPSRYPHCTECRGSGCNISIHAEMNAIAFAAKQGVNIEGGTMYVTMSPCINCAKVVLNSGILRLVYLEEYREKRGLELLSDYIICERIHLAHESAKTLECLEELSNAVHLYRERGETKLSSWLEELIELKLEKGVDL